MSAFLDDLARSMAAAMTRRDAARILVGGVVGVVFPGARALGWAQTYPCKQGEVECLCPGHYKGNYRLCCQPDRVCQCIPLAAVCTPKPCPGPMCGPNHCCLADEVCADPGSGTCCKTGESSCTIAPKVFSDPVPRGRCCPPTQVCQHNYDHAACCKPGMALTANGDCGCPPERPLCGTECCPKTQRCLGGECCDPPKACGAKCCQSGERCIANKCTSMLLH